MHRNVIDLIKVAKAGGGFTVSVRGYDKSQLIRIAAAAKENGCRVHFSDAADASTEDLVDIAVAGGGRVSFDL